MNEVLTPDGWGQVLRTQSAHGRTSYLVKGAGFEGWYDGLQIQADFADDVDDVVPNDDNSTALPYPSRPQGPGWDGSTSTIPPDIDPHIEMGHASDSLTGESTSESPEGADLDSDFAPPSRLAGVRARRVHFASSDDPILNVHTLPEDSPVGLDNSPINPDDVSTDDLFEGGGREHFAAATYDRLVLEDDLSFMRFASDDDDSDDKKNHREQDMNDDDDNDSDDSSDSDSDSSDSDGDGGGDGGSGGHTAAFALSTTADLHFLANYCACDESIPLHSKQEHRELEVEAAAKKHADGNTNGVDAQPRDLDQLEERYRQDQLFHPAPLDLVDHSLDDKDNADLYNKLAFVRHADGYDKYIGGSDGHYYLIASGNGKLPKGEHYGHYETYEDAHRAVEAIIARNHAHHGSKTAAPAQPPQPTQIESQIEQLMQFWAVDNNGWWHWTGSQSDLALLNQMQQQMMAVGMPSGQPGAMQTQSAVAGLAPLLEAGAAEGAAAGEAGAAEGASSEAGGGLGKALSGGGGGGSTSPAGMMSGLAGAIEGFNGGTDLGVAHHGIPFRHSFVIEEGTPPRWREYLQTLASDKLVALAAWRDVVDKSKRLRSEGAIQVEVFKPEVITAYVQGDHGRYYTTVQRLGSAPNGAGRQLTSTQVSGWSCECEWGHWVWLRKRSFVGRMCSHAYALFSEMRSLDAKARKNKGKPLSAGKFASVAKTAWSRDGENFVWVSNDPTAPTAAIIRVGSAWGTKIWSDGTAEDAFSLGIFQHSERARRAIARVINAHMKLADDGDVDLVGGGDFSPGGQTSYEDPYGEMGEPRPEPLLDQYDEPVGPGQEQSTTKTGFTAFAEAKDGDDDEGPEEDDNGIEEEDDPDDDESLDEEIAEDEDDSNDGQDDEGDESEPDNDEAGDGGHYEPHKRDDDDDEDHTDNPGDESDDHHVEKQSSVAELQQQFGLSHLAGANYSEAAKRNLEGEGKGQTARNRGELNLTGTHYEAAAAEAPEDTLAFLF